MYNWWSILLVSSDALHVFTSVRSDFFIKVPFWIATTIFKSFLLSALKFSQFSGFLCW